MDFDFDDEIIIEDDVNYNILTNDVLQNFPFLEDDIDAITDYELISKTYEYLDDKKANKEDIPKLDNYYNKDEVDDLLDEKVDNEELNSYYNKTEVNSLLDTKANVSDIPDVSNFITKDVNDLTYYTKSSDLSSVATSGDYGDLLNKPTIPDVSNFITKDVNDLTYYTKSSDLSSVATSGDYGDLLNKPTIPTVPTNVSSFNNDAGYITKSVNNLTNYTDTSALTTLLAGKENSIDIGSNANGYYIKFSDGTAICWNSYSGTKDINYQIGSGYRSTSIGGGSLPITLLSVSGAWANGQVNFVNENQWAWSVTNNNATTTTFPSMVFLSNYSTTSRSYTVYTFVIGKWK